MKKSRALELLGGTVASACKALNITSQAFSQWPEELPARLVDRVIAGLLRTGRKVPNDLLVREAKTA